MDADVKGYTCTLNSENHVAFTLISHGRAWLVAWLSTLSPSPSIAVAAGAADEGCTCVVYGTGDGKRRSVHWSPRRQKVITESYRCYLGHFLYSITYSCTLLTITLTRQCPTAGGNKHTACTVMCDSQSGPSVSSI